MSTVPCPNCGRLNRPGARFCASCQAGLTGDLAPSSGGGTPQALWGTAQTGGPQAGQLLGGGSYRVVRPLGKGGMGAVWLVAQTRAFDRLAVLKEVIDYFDPGDADARRRAAERFEAEARTLADLKHPGIPDLYAFFSEAGHNYLVMEYIEGQDLSKGLTREDRDTGQLLPGAAIPAEQVIHYTIEICEVLEYLARCQPPVVHNDIKPANIIVDSHSGRAVLVDFGTARTRYLRTAGRSDPSKEEVYGTVGYAAPELYQGRSESRSDVYSLAATAYHLLTDDDPGDNPGQYPKLDALPPGMGNILRPALAVGIEDRPTAERLRQSLEGYLAGATASVRGLSFPDRSEVTTLPQFVLQAARHWPYAAGLLQDGTLARWLRGTLRDASAARAAEDAVARWPGDADAALDAFLRQVAPGVMPAGRLELRTTQLLLSAPDLARSVPSQIELANRGAGYLRGKAFSTQPWLKVGALFSCPPGGQTVLPVEAHPAGLAPGSQNIAAVTLEPEGGTPEVVPVQMVIAAGQAAAPAARARASIRVQPERVDLGRVPRTNISTDRQRIVVTSLSGERLHCRVVDAPAWLQVKPADFRLAPGKSETLEMVGRVSKIPGSGEDVTLGIAVEGGTTRPVQVSVRIRGR